MTGAFRALHLRRFRSHPGRTAVATLGVGIATTLVTAILGLHASLIHSVEQLVDLAGRADVEISGATDTGFEQDVFFEVEAIDGVEHAVPAVRSTVVIDGEEALLLGFDDRARFLGQTAASEIEAQIGDRELNGLLLAAPLAARAGLSEGDPVTVVGGGRTIETTVVVVLDGFDETSLNRGLVAAAPLPLAQRFAGMPGRLDVLWVVASEGVGVTELRSRLDEAVGDRTVVASPRLRAEQAADDLETLRQQLLVIASAVLVVAGFLIFNTMSMVALERRRELATLRALGGRRRRLLAGFLAESAVLGAAGAAAGVGAGTVVTHGVIGNIPPVFTTGRGVGVVTHIPISVFLAAVVTGLTATITAAFVPARRAVNVPPVEAMRPEGVLETHGETERVNWPAALGGITVVGTGAVFTAGWVGDLVLVGAALLVLGGLVATWGFTPAITKTVAGLTRVAGRTGALAAAAVERAPRRTWATTAGVAVGVALVVAVGGINANSRTTTGSIFAPLRGIDLVLQTGPLDDFPTRTLMPVTWQDDLAALPGIEAVRRGQFATIAVEGRQGVLQGVEPGSNPPIIAAADPPARRAVREGRGLLVSSHFAHHHDLAEGDAVELLTPTGSRVVPIVGVAGFVPGPGSGLAAISIDRLEEWYGRAGASYFELDVAPGASLAEVRSEVERFVATSDLPVTVASGEELYENVIAISDLFNQVIAAMAWVAAAAAALGILNTLMLSVIERRREVGILRAIGAGRRQVTKMVMLEAGGIATVGMLVGIALGLVMHWSAIRGAGQLIGFPIDYGLAVWPLILAVLLAAVMSLLGGLGPARRAARVNVITAIGYE